MTTTSISLLWLLGATAAVFLLLRFRAPMWSLLALALVPTIVLSADIALRTVAVHGLMHLGFVYEILERGVPPENPLLGGEPLHYPWGHHLAIAGAARLGVPPGWSFAATHVLALLLFCMALDRAAAALDRNRIFRVFAVALALFGTTPFVRPPLASVAAGLGIPLEPRAIPWLKFLGVNSNSIGLAFTALALLGLVGIVTGGLSPRASYAALLFAVLGSAFFYPMSFLAIGLWTAVAVCWLASRRDSRPAAVRMAAAAALGALPALPYLWLVSHGRSSTGSLQEPPTGAYALRHAWIILTILALPAALAVLRARGTTAWLRARPRAAVLLAFCAAAALAVFVLGFIRTLIAYKLLLAALLPLGLLAAVPLRDLYDRLPAAALAVLALVLLPTAWGIGATLTQGWPVTDPLVERGVFVEPSDPAEHYITSWIAGETPREALFIDRRRTIPPFGRRQLFVALAAEPAPPGTRDGWGMASELLLGEVMGADPERVERRQRIGESLLDPTSLVPLESSLAELDVEAEGRAVYVVARDEKTAARLSRAAGLRQVWHGPAATVFRREPVTESPERSTR